MRKIVSVILVTALLLAGLFVLTGCGTDGDAEKSNANTKKVTLSLIHRVTIFHG